MISYLARRGTWAVFTLWAISLATFGLGRMVPGDPVDFAKKNFSDPGPIAELPEETEARYNRDARELGLDRPTFYLTLTTAIYPDTFYKIMRRDRRQALAALLEQTGDWPRVQAYSAALREAVVSLEKMPDSLGADQKTALRKNLQNLLTARSTADITSILAENRPLIEQKPAFSTPFLKKLDEAAAALAAAKPGPGHWLPALYWHGTDNQYHHWLSGFLAGKGEKSWASPDKTAFQRVREALPITLALSGTGLLLGYLLAVPLGVFSARRAGSRTERWLHTGLLAFWSMPVFWLASLSVVFLTSGTSGIKLFPGIGLGELPETGPFWPRFFEKAAHLTLPVLLIGLHSTAYLARLVRGSVLGQAGELYVRTARAKGLPEPQVFWRHALPNALFPLIAHVGSLLPATIAGSVVIEVIFQIPGMGSLAMQSFQGHDWPVVFCIVLFSALLTVAGGLLADLLYAWADPRVRF